MNAFIFSQGSVCTHPGRPSSTKMHHQSGATTVRNSSSGPFRRPTLTRAGAAIAAVAALALGLSACGGSDDDSDSSSGKPVEVTITTFGEFGYSDNIAAWNAANPDIHVTERKIGKWDDWKVELTTKLQAGSGLPDIVGIEGDMIPAIVANPDAWVDLSDPSVEGRWLKFKSDAATTSDGKLVGYATDAGPEGVCYRKDLFAKAGLPTDRTEVAKLMGSWDDYFALGEQYVKANPKSKWYDSSGATAQALLNQLETPFEKTDGSIYVDGNAQLKQVYDTVVSHVGDLSTRNKQWSDDWTASFKNDGFATIMCPGWMKANIATNSSDDSGKVLPGIQWDIADAFPGGGGNWGGSYLGVPTQSKHQKEAQKVAAWLTAPEQQVKAFEKAGVFPSQVDALADPAVTGFTDPIFGDAPYGQILANRANAITVSPFHGPHYSDILGLFQAAVDRVDEGSADAAGSWKTFLEAVKQL